MKEETEKVDVKDKKPDENSSVDIQGHIRIYDPNTKEEFVNKRDT